MKRILALLMLGAFALVASGANAAENAQNTKMADCQKQAGDKKLEGKDRQAFVNNCLKAKPAAAPAPDSKSKMAECNAKTKGMSKDEANKARSDCMKAS